MRKANDKTIKLVEVSESCRLTAYRCPSGLWTIGYGHTGPEVVEGMVITPEQALDYLRKDLGEAEQAVETLVKQTLTDDQFGALVDFVYNCGTGAFMGSTLLQLIRTGQFSKVPDELKKWHHGKGGVDLPGLMARRAAEAAMWLGKEVIGGDVGGVIEAAATASVHIQNVNLVDAVREDNAGKVTEAVAQLAKDGAMTAVMDAVAPFLGDQTARTLQNAGQMAESAIEAAVARLKLPDATVALFPNRERQ